jgi:hypothetical protein
LSSLSEIDTVDSDAETERIDDLDDDTEQPLLDEVNVEDGDEEPLATSVVGTSEDENRETSPSRGRKRRRATDIDDIDDQDDKPLDMDDEDHDAKRARNELEDIDKPADPNDMPPEEIEEPEEPEPEESIPLDLLDRLMVVDEEKAEAQKNRFAALEFLTGIEEDFAKLRDRYPSLDAELCPDM